MDTVTIFLERYGWAVIAVLMSMIEIAPIKINPWSALLKYIGSKLNGELQKDIQSIKTDVQTLDKKIEAVRESSEVIEVKQSRVRILRFDEELLKGEEHTKEHFNQILDDIDLYESYCDKHEGFHNGIARHAIRHIRYTYDELGKKRAFYKEQAIYADEGSEEHVREA